MTQHVRQKEENMPHQKKRKRQQPGRFLSLLILIFIALLVFEGNLLINIFKKDSLTTQVNAQIDELLASTAGRTKDTETESETKAPAPAVTTEPPAQAETLPTTVSDALVPEQNIPIDDSYFSDAVFIGDSRMEGFRNQSGITQGTFLTGVGMNVTDIFTQKYIHLYNEQITVYQALYNTDYKKVYVMLGTNDLGEPDFNDFKENYRVCLGEIKKMLPDAIVYVISIAYVEEAKVEDTSYVNNKNITTANEKILELCEEQGYHYININEVLSDGNGALTEGATSDGVHMYDTYCKIWLEYLKDHYILEEPPAESPTPEAETQPESQTESPAQPL